MATQAPSFFAGLGVINNSNWDQIQKAYQALESIGVVEISIDEEDTNPNKIFPYNVKLNWEYIGFSYSPVPGWFDMPEPSRATGGKGYFKTKSGYIYVEDLQRAGPLKCAEKS